MIENYPEPLDVVSSHWTRDYALASKCFFGRVPVFVTIRDIIPHVLKKQSNIRNYLLWSIIYLKNEFVLHTKRFKFIANSEYTARMVKQNWGKNIPVIPNSIDIGIIEKSRDSRIQDDNNKDYVISTISASSVNDRNKNIIPLLTSFQYLRQKYPNFRLNLIGPYFRCDNPEIMQLREEGLMDGITLRGKLSHYEVIDELLHSDLLVHPSLEETFGNTLIEAMLTRCAVLGGNESGAVPYVLEGGKAGFLCDVSNATSLTNMIEYIYSNPHKVKEKIEYAEKLCIEKYSSVKIAEAYINLFKIALNELEG